MERTADRFRILEFENELCASRHPSPECRSRCVPLHRERPESTPPISRLQLFPAAAEPRDTQAVTAVAAPDLLERENECAELEAGLKSAAAGAGRVVLIRGPAGIGKTRLLEELRCAGQRREVAILTARCGEIERDFAFGVVRQLFEPRVARASDAEQEALFAGAAAPSAPLFGGRRRQVTVDTPSDTTSSTLHGLYWLTAHLAAARPVAVIVDDAHVADAASLRWLAFLARRVADLPALITLAVRSGEAGAEAPPLAELGAEPTTQVIEPSPLTPAAVVELVRRVLPAEASPELAAACHRATGGNPFLLRELLNELSARAIETAVSAEQVAALGPEAIARAVLVRLARLPPEAAEIAKALAVLGDRSELQHVAALASIDLETAEQAADALAKAEIVSDERPLRFVHPVVRAAVAEELPAGARAHAHACAARLLSAAGAEPHELAPHLTWAEPAADAWVVQTLRRAAEWARERGSPESACAYLARASREPPPHNERWALLLELGTAELAVGAPDTSDHLRAAMASSDPNIRARASAGLARALLYDDRPREAIEVLEQTLDHVDGADTEVRLRLERQLIAYSVFDPERRPSVAPRLDVLRSEFSDAVPGGHALLALEAFDRVLSGASAADVSALAERALAGDGLVHEVGAAGIEPLFAIVALVFADSYDAAASALATSLSMARSRGDAVAFAVNSCFRALLLLRQGRVDAAQADAEASLEILGDGSWRPMAFAMLIEALIERGELGAARAVLARAEAEGARDTNLQLNLLGHSRGLLLLSEGHPGAAVDQLLESGRRQTAWGVWNPSALPWRSNAARGLVAIGESEGARQLATEEVRLARTVGAPRALGVALRARARVEGGHQGLDLLRESEKVLASSGARLEHAHTLLELGTALRRSGQRAAARDPLREGLDLAHRCGGVAAVERARHELRALGVRVPRSVLFGPDALTPSERRVADTVARGLSNRDAAQALFVTEKTIEAHLSRAYRKLDIHSRTELAHALSDYPSAS
jgi:DNA-binding CsgD family transcriptional regulator